MQSGRRPLTNAWPQRRGIRWLGLWALLLGLGALTMACARTGAYPLDIFMEMHYQQAVRVQEPPRMQPPVGAVPVSGKEPEAAIGISFADAESLRNPVPRTPAVLARGQRLFQTNCAACHGQKADGQSPTAARFQAVGVPPPAFASFAPGGARPRTDGQLFYVLSNGRGFMPNFSKLLSVEERWTLVHFSRAVAEGQVTP